MGHVLLRDWASGRPDVRRAHYEAPAEVVLEALPTCVDSPQVRPKESQAERRRRMRATRAEALRKGLESKRMAAERALAVAEEKARRKTEEKAARAGMSRESFRLRSQLLCDLPVPSGLDSK